MIKADNFVLGLDIGGANIKAVLLDAAGNKTRASRIAVQPFEIWQSKDSLSLVLAGLKNELAIAGNPPVAVTMTAELADSFASKREGVLHILDQVEIAFPDATIFIFTLDNVFLELEEARKRPLGCAASNWLASAGLTALFHPDCIMVDIGSTTTDIIPVFRGKVINQGFTDPERLMSGELLYTGVVRTNPNVIVSHIPFRGRATRVAAEYFACMADVYLVLGMIDAKAYTCPCPDNREKTAEDSRQRLARLICADAEIMEKKEIEAMAAYLFEKQVQQVTESLLQVLSCLTFCGSLPFVTMGSGRFLANEAARRLGIPVIDMSSCPLVAFPAHAAAFLLARDLDLKHG